jgi:hypothetical protein
MNIALKTLLPAALFGLSGFAAAAPVLFPNGNFETAGGADWGFDQANGHTVSYPATGGNPNGHAIIDGTLATETWYAVLITNGNAPYPLASLGLQAGKKYKFMYDMKSQTAGANKGGIKIESWTATNPIGDSGEKRKTTTGTGWASYEEEYTIDPTATHIKVVPLWTSNETVAFDNVAVDNTPIFQPPIVPVVPNGDFEIPGGGFNVGANWAYFTDTIPASHQATGGNPGGNVVIDATVPGGYGVLVAFNNAEATLASLGLQPGGTYTFQMDMKIISGSNLGGLKLEGPDGYVYENRPVAPLVPNGQWATYSWQVTLPLTLTRFKIVPIWGIGSSVAFDNVKILLPEPVKATIEKGTLVNWTPTSAENTYQVQESANNSTWTNLGTPFTGTGVTSTFDATKSPYYQVVESAPAFVNAVFNPGFEETGSSPADGWNNIVALNGGSASAGSSHTGGFVPDSGDQMLIIESITGPVDPVPAPDINVRSDQIEITGGQAYTLTFRAAHVQKTGGGNPQFYLMFEDGSNNFISDTFQSFSLLGSSWATVTRNFTAPANAVYVKVGFIQAVGAGANWHWVTLIDNVSILVPGQGGVLGTLPATTAPGVRISWNTMNGATYQVRSSTTLGGWTNFGSAITGDGDIWSVTDTITPPAKFYQVGETTP